MIELKKEYLRFVFLSIVICTIIFALESYQATLKVRGDNSNYPNVEIGDSINAEVVSVRKIRSVGRVLFSDGRRKTFVFADNRNYDPSDLPSFLRKGDIVAKSGSNDSIVIHRMGQKYFFRLGRQLN